MKKLQQVEQMVIVRNKTIIGLKFVKGNTLEYEQWVRNKTIIGLKSK